MGPATPFTERWFKSGERLGYDARARAIDESASRKVFVRADGDPTHAVTFLPGFPDGSIGWGKVLPYLPDAATMPKLFVEYLGMGDSDKPRDYAYSTAERTDLVEALWRHFGVESTTLVAFDFSTLVVLEHLARRLEGRSSGPAIAEPFSLTAGFSPTAIHIRGLPLRYYDVCPSIRFRGSRLRRFSRFG